jgi:hypothetical protein
LEGRTSDPVSDAPSCAHDIAVVGPDVVVVDVGCEVVVDVGACWFSA